MNNIIKIKNQEKIPDSSKVASGAIVIGDVSIGENVGIWYNAVIRCESGHVIIGDNSNVQDNAVIHLDPGEEVSIGDGVTIGHGAIVHGSTIGDNTVIGMGAIVLGGAMVGENCIIGAGAVVTGGMIVPDGSMVLGIPGKVVRKLTLDEIEHNKENARHYVSFIKDMI